MEEMPDEILEALARFFEAAVQASIDDITKLYSMVPESFAFTFLVALNKTLEGLLPLLDDAQKGLYENMVANGKTAVVVLPYMKGDNNDEDHDRS